MTSSRPLRAALALTLITLVASCATGPAPESPTVEPTETDGPGHGAVEGAAEVSEPPLGLLTVDAEGRAGLLDLVSGEAREIGRIAEPRAIASDGRSAFVTTDDGVAVVDSGLWTWDHGDHFHYYRGQARIVGQVEGSGPATVTTGASTTSGTTGIHFAGSNEAVLIDNSALSQGEIREQLRVATSGETGMIAPLGDGALVGDADGLRYLDATGAETASSDVFACEQPEGAITTRAGLVIGCADGAVVVTMDRGEPAVTSVPYPADAAERATVFDARKGRPSVAAVAGSTGFWLLDAREATWRHVGTDAPLERVVAIDDEKEHVVALDDDGRLLVFRGDESEPVAMTEPLVDDALAEASQGDDVGLVVDGQRAYLSDPVAGIVYEIDYADGARVARELVTDVAPRFFTEVGR